LPTVILTEGGDLHHVNEQMQGVVREIERVVEQLQQREREVLRADQMVAVGQMAAGVAHELRNPLTSIKMLVQANREEAEAHGPPAEDLQMIEQEIRRMERCLQTFLDFARPPKPERRPVSLAMLVDRTFALVEGRARKQHVTLHCTHPTTPVIVEADADQMQQVLVNLALNALDAMPRGGSLDVSLGAPVHGQIELRVRDTVLVRALLPRSCRGCLSLLSAAKRPVSAWVWSFPGALPRATAAICGSPTRRTAAPALSSACRWRGQPQRSDREPPDFWRHSHAGLAGD